MSVQNNNIFIMAFLSLRKTRSFMGFSGWWDELTSYWDELTSYIEELFTPAAWVKEWVATEYQPAEEVTTSIEEGIYYTIPESWTAPKAKTIDEIIEEKSSSYGLPSNIIHAVVAVESNFNPAAWSFKGARGLMQLMPGTAKWLGFDPEALWDPEINIEAGVKYLRWLYDKYGNIWDAVAAYNQGSVIKTQKGTYVNQGYVNRVYSASII